MPKLKQKTYRPPTRIVKLKTNIENAVNEGKTYSGMTTDEFYEYMGCCSATYWRKINDPDRFTLEDLRKISVLCGKPLPEFLASIVS